MMKTASRSKSKVEIPYNTRQIIERYGFTVNRSGFMSCPFHSGDHSPSLKVYCEPGKEDRGWYCFGCLRGGNGIGFVMELFGIKYQEAVMRIMVDMGAVSLDAVTTKILKEKKELRQIREGLIKEYNKVANIRCDWHLLLKYLIINNFNSTCLYTEAEKQVEEYDCCLYDLNSCIGRLDN